jgi:hypothetical protein
MVATLAFAPSAPVAAKHGAFTGCCVQVKPQSVGVMTAKFKMPKMPGMPGRADKGEVVPAQPAPAAPVAKKEEAAPKGGKGEEPKKPSPKKAAPFASAAPLGGAAGTAKGGVKFFNSATARYVFKADAKGHGSTAFDSRIGGPAAGTNARANANGTFRNMDPYTGDPKWARANWSPADADVAVRAVFRNILGNAHVVEEEVAELASQISCYKQTGETKEFVRAVALSSAYKSRYFEDMSNMRFVELNFKHFLGRAPMNQPEISAHIQTLVNEGYNAEINSYLDSDEYDTLWGDERVPQPNFRGGHDANQGMNSLANLRGGYARSDRVSTKATFPAGYSMASTSTAIANGLPEAWRSENAARTAAGTLYAFPECFWNPAGGRDFPRLNDSPAEVAEAALILKFGTLNSKVWV